VKVVLQDGIKDCGICCLLSIIKYYGGDVSKEYLREITSTTKDGVSFYNLMEGAKIVGFDTWALTGKLEEINVNNLPCIVHVIVNKSYKHFIVLYQINYKKRQVTIMDPAKGKKVLSFSEYNLLTSGNYLFLTPTKKLPIIKKKNIIIKNVLKTIKLNKLIIIIILILTNSYFILNLIISFHFKILLEYSINYKITENIFLISNTILTIYILKNFNNILKNTILYKWIVALDNEIMTTTYKQILLLPYLYYKNRTTGEVISRFQDLNTIRAFLQNLLCTISTDFLSIIIFSITMYHYSRRLSLIIWSFSLILIILAYCFGLKKRKLKKRLYRHEDNINNYLIDGISNVDTIKGSHLEKRLIDKFSLKYKQYLEAIYKYNFNIELLNFLKDNIEDLIYIFIYSLGSYYVIVNKMSLSNLIVYQLFTTYFIGCLLNLAKTLDDFNDFKLALSRVEELFLINEEEFRNNYFYLPYTLDGSIIINNLNYKFGAKNLFNNLFLEIKSGEKILLCGDSGSGKSTLVKMLMRYIEIPFNIIRISGIDINHYHLENLRTNITYITSNEYLFTDTIKNNILLNKNITEEEFKKVCNLCLVSDLVSNEEQSYNKLVEENGFNFSNGERQRIILARSVLRKSNIYIFDEALGQIDINREKKILTNIFDYLHNKTIIVISHRFNNKKLFDRVLKLEKGVIIETKKL